MGAVNDELAVTFAVSKASNKARKEILDRAAAHSADLSAIDTAVAELRATNWSPTYDETAAQLRTRQRAAVVEEVAIREAVDQWFNHVATVDWPLARDAAYQECEKAKADVEKRLLSIGYQKVFDLGDGVERSDLPAMIAAHPSVRAAVVQSNSLIDHGTLARRQANAVALDACRKQLASYQMQATSGLAAA